MQQNLFNFIELDMERILETVSNCVGATLGPNGKVAILGNGEKSFTTKDGVSVLRIIRSSDPFINNVINVIRESAENTLREAGDGTTSTVILAHQMLKGLKNNAFTPSQLKDKINQMVNKLPEISEELDDKKAKQLIVTATGGERELADVLYDAYLKSKNDDLAIVVEPELGAKTKAEVVNGIFFRAKIVAELFEKNNHRIKDPHIVCYSGTVETEREVVKAIDKAKKLGIENMIIIANRYTEEALSIMSINHLQGVINIVPLAVDGGDMHNNDIISVIAKALCAEVGGEDFSSRLYDAFTKPYDKVKEFRYENGKAVFEGIDCDADVSEEMNKFLTKAKEASDDTDMNKFLFLASMLKRKMVKVTIGANLQNKLSELKDRADDAIQSLLTAKEYGVVEGAGEAYIKLNSMTDMPDRFTDVFSVINKRIGSVKGAIDSAKVIKAVLLSASDLAMLLYNTKFVINLGGQK